MKQWISRSLLFFAAILTFYGGGRLYFYLTDGFSIANISSHLTSDSRWETKQEEGNLRKILQQPYRYLGKGCQSYVFSSEDGQYVIKFFKFQHLRTEPFWKDIPLPKGLAEKGKQSIQRRENKKNRLFNGCKVAIEEIPDETGIEFVHLNPTKHLNTSLILIDKLGLKHTINANDFAFFIQKRATPASEYISKREDPDVFKKIASLIKKRDKKGVEDLDPATIQNIGFANSEALLLDVGQVVKNSQISSSEDIKKRRENVLKWLENNHPELISKFESDFN